jgi:hypothetical protein
VKNTASEITNIGQYIDYCFGCEEHWAIQTIACEISSRIFPGVGAWIAVVGIAPSFVSGCGSPVSQGGA